MLGLSTAETGWNRFKRTESEVEGAETEAEAEVDGAEAEAEAGCEPLASAEGVSDEEEEEEEEEGAREDRRLRLL